MTSAKAYKQDLERKTKSLGARARNAVRRAVNPTPAEMRAKAARLREVNAKKEDRVRALEETRKQRVKAQRLREREAAARRPIPVKSSGRTSSAARYSGSSSAGSAVDLSFFGEINQNPFGGRPSGGSSPKKSKGSKRQDYDDPLEFFYH